MNEKIGMRAFSTLLAVMLMSAMLVPVMAVEEVWQSQGTEQNVQYDMEKYTVRLVDSEIPKELISARTQTAMSSFEEEFKNVPPRYIGTAEVDISEGEKVVAYVFRVLPNGESVSYAEVVSSEDNPSLEEISSHADAWIDGPLKSKTAESLKEGSFGLLSYGPTPIHTATISRTYTGVGRAYLTTTWYWDNQETNSNQDYFFTKTTLRTDPGIDISGYEPYRNYQFNVEIDSDYSVPGYYQHLPGVYVSQNNPQTTTGYTTVGLSLGTGGCVLQWSTAIPDTRVELHHPYGNTYNWDEEFNLWASCAATTFEFTPGQQSYCSQSSARDGSTYVISRAMADVSNGWEKIVDGIVYFAPSGTNAWGHLCKVKWSGGYVQT
ncbi:hypothetical protein [Methanoculleus thermophilus]|uniref:Uncharacterized protein n=1 Tax=Methanoculleus thermophilus TaxID=2200 RepID=A0A1G8X378_9EURY|nr:hypothetical protein [Methanoculleus thermophilus]SDJ84797.1 hypothetical protein SAMN04488571_101220 [Methanoculleus thermophilus]